MLKFLLRTECYDYKLYMTDILFVDGPNFENIEEKIPIHEEIIKIMGDNQFFCTKIDPYTLQTLIPFALLKPQNQINPFYDFFLALTIKFSDNMLFMKASIFSDNGSLISACTQFQRTFLIKFAAAFNQNNSDLQVVVHPLTGDILIQYSLWIPNYRKLSSLILGGLSIFQKRSSIIYRMLQALELISAEQPQNIFFSNVLEKIQPLRPLFWLKNQQAKISQKDSQQKKMHQNTNLIAENSGIEIYSNLNVNMIQKMKKTFVEDELLYHVHNSAKLKLHNFLYISLDPTPQITNLNKDIENGNILPQGQFRIAKFKSQGREIFIQYKSQKPESIGYQYSIVDKISKKKNYVSFLKSYLVPKNYFALTTHYLMTLKQSLSLQCQTVNKYLRKNKNILSFETKLKILSQLSSIACVSLERIQNFEPSFELSNFQIDKNFSFKIINIQKSQINPRMDILQLFYRILFEKKYFTMRKDELKRNRFVSLEQLNLQRYGPSVLLKIFIKLLQVYEEGFPKPSIQNILLTVNKLQQVYENIAQISLIQGQGA